MSGTKKSNQALPQSVYIKAGRYYRVEAIGDRRKLHGLTQTTEELREQQ